MLECASGALKLERRLLNRVDLLAEKGKHGDRVRKIWRQQSFLASHRPPAVRELLESVADARDRVDPYFVPVTSEYPMETLARGMLIDLELTLPEVERLRELHEMKFSQLAEVKMALTTPWAVSLFVLGFCLKTVPVDPFKYYHAEAAYPQFELVVCTVWAVVALVLAGRGLDTWMEYQKAKRQHTRLGELLGYCKLLAEEDEALREVGRPPQT